MIMIKIYLYNFKSVEFYADCSLSLKFFVQNHTNLIKNTNIFLQLVNTIFMELTVHKGVIQVVSIMLVIMRLGNVLPKSRYFLPHFF